MKDKIGAADGLWVGALALLGIAVYRTWDNAFHWWAMAALVAVFVWPAARAMARGFMVGMRSDRPIIEDKPEPQPDKATDDA